MRIAVVMALMIVGCSHPSQVQLLDECLGRAQSSSDGDVCLHDAHVRAADARAK